MTTFQLLTFDDWLNISADLTKKINSAVVYIYIISWVFLGGFVFRNVFVGVMGIFTTKTVQIADLV